MATTKIQTKAAKLQAWITAAEIRKKKWMDEYKVAALQSYYKGKHYVGQTDEYYVNMFHATIEQKLPNMAFTNPRFFITPKPSQLAIDPEQAFQVASNLEDAMFDWTSEEANKFADEVEMAALDTFFGFGVVEIGYSAKFTENPNVPRPEIPSDYQDDAEDKKAKEIEIAVSDEQVFARQISFENFLVSAMNSRYLDRCDWFGYYEYYRVADLKADKNLINTDKLSSGNYSSLESGTGITSNYDEDMEDRKVKLNGDYVKVYKIWDTRSKRRFMFCEDACVILHEKKWKYNPFEIMCFRFPQKGFYPIPYTYNWIPMQNELNETREAHRQHRRKFKRLYEMLSGTADLDDVKNYLNGPDGGLIEVSKMGQIQPIPTAELGASANISMQVTKEDFNVVSGTTSEWQGQGDRITATQATITNDRATVRESREKTIVGKFLVKLAKKIIMTMKDNYVNKRIVAKATPTEDFGNDIQNKPEVREIDPLTDFGNDKFDFELNVSVESVSPVQTEEEKNKFLSFISLIKQFPEFASHPTIIREMAFRTGYKNEQIIKSFQQMAQLAMVSQASQGQQNLGQQGGNLAQQTVAQQTPPNVEEIQNQMANQGMPMSG